MARPLRVEYPGAFYHVINRGNAGEDVFKSLRDREKFLEYLETATSRFSIPQLKKFKSRVVIDDIVSAVGKSFGSPPEQILSKGKKRNSARDVAIYLTRDLTGMGGKTNN
jgi:chromosomal replication initiation ATPase DnaA